MRIDSDASAYQYFIVKAMHNKNSYYEGHQPLFMSKILGKFFNPNFSWHLFMVLMVAIGYDFLAFLILISSSLLINYFNGYPVHLTLADLIKLLAIFWLIPTHYISVRLFSLGYRSFITLTTALIFPLIFFQLDSINNNLFYFILFILMILIGFMNVALSQFAIQNIFFISIWFAFCLNDSRAFLMFVLGTLLMFFFGPREFLIHVSERFNYFAWYTKYLDYYKNRINKKEKRKYHYLNIRELNFELPLNQLIFSTIWLFSFVILINYIELRNLNNYFVDLYTHLMITGVILCFFIQLLPNLKIFGESVRYLASVVLITPFLIVREILLIPDIYFIFFLIISLVFIFLFSRSHCKNAINDFKRIYNLFQGNSSFWWLDNKAHTIYDFLSKNICLSNFDNILILPLKYASLVATIQMLITGKISILKTQYTSDLMFSYHDEGNRNLPNIFRVRSLGITHIVCTEDFFKLENIASFAEIISLSDILPAFDNSKLVLAKIRN